MLLAVLLAAAVLLAGESSRAMLASARLSCFDFLSTSKLMAGKSIPDMAYLVSSWTLNLNSVNQSLFLGRQKGYPSLLIQRDSLLELVQEEITGNPGLLESGTFI